MALALGLSPITGPSLEVCAHVCDECVTNVHVCVTRRWDFLLCPRSRGHAKRLSRGQGTAHASQ